MELRPTSEFLGICQEIVAQHWSPSEWAAHEAGDWFQTEHFEGGFEADETYENGEFNFSFHDESGKEWWFTFSLKDVSRFLSDNSPSITLIDPETFDMDTLKNNGDSQPKHAR